MQIHTVPVSEAIATNTYFYIDEQTGHGFLIDPAAEAQKLRRMIEDNNWTIEKMLITHGHFDHIGAVDYLHTNLNIPYYIHTQGKDYLADPSLNLSSFFGTGIILNNALLFNDGDNISLSGGQALQVIHTPGHTQDSVLFYDKQNNLAFVGDTIFKASVGRTDFPGGNHQQLKESIEQKVFTLPDTTALYSGHTAPTTVGEEKKNFHLFF